MLLNYIKTKLLYQFLTLFGVITIVFFLFNVLPGDPAKMIAGQRENSEQLNNIKKKFGLNEPVYLQYLYYLNDLSPLSIHENNNNTAYTYLNKNSFSFIKLLTINSKSIVLKYPYLRISFLKEGKKVSSIIKETLPNTAILAVSSMLIAFVFGIIFGIYSAIKKDSLIDKLILILTSFGMSIPSFFAAIIISWIFSFLLNKYTHLNLNGSLFEVDEMGNGEYLNLKNLILPTITLGMRPLSIITQLTRSSFLEELTKDYVRTAYAKGLPEYKIIKNHILKNSLNPVITSASSWFASLLAGAVFVEFIFGWNGIGKELINALNFLDLPVIMGIVLVISTLFILINLIVDLLYIHLDKRIKL